MTEVVAFKPRVTDQDMIFVCNCGSASFQLRGDGEAVCAKCEVVVNMSVPHKWWKEPEALDLAEEAPEEIIGGNADGGVFAERSIKRLAQEADWLICGTFAGRISSWSREFIETDEQRLWLREKAEYGLGMILEDKPKASA
jgi:hypothetical protein